MEYLIKYKKIIFIGAACFVVLLIFLWVIAYIQNWSFNSGIKQDQNQVNALTNQAQQINANIANLHEQDAVKREQIKQLEQKRSQTRHDYENSKTTTNQALSNANAIRNGNYTNSSANDGERARCEAYPSDPGCS